MINVSLRINFLHIFVISSNFCVEISDLSSNMESELRNRNILSDVGVRVMIQNYE